MRATLALAFALMTSVSIARAGDLKSGPQPGEGVGPFTVEKIAGAVNDNVEPGKNLCYRCMLGSKPVVMVFARKTDGNLASLVKALDKSVAEHADQKLSSFVNLLGDNADTLKTTAKDFVAKNKLENVALVVPEENQNGPADYKISPQAEVTVLIYREGKVVANHALAPGELNDKSVASILADTGKILK